MIPWVVIALLAGAFALGWVGRSVRAAAREHELRCELADADVEAAAATFAWRLASDRADAGYDIGFGEAAGIRVDLGSLDP
jgi:hypothetical protein